LIDFALLFTSVFWAFIFSIYAYNSFLALIALKRPKKIPRHDPSKKFACMIPAHNEENVIGVLVNSLRNQNYPKHLYSVFVVADHCSDHTAEIARERGSRVFERSQGPSGKGNVIRFFLEKLFNQLHEEKFDTVCFFDADNTVHVDFLQKMNDALCEGENCIQGYLGIKNPRGNWVTKAIYGSYLVTNRLWQLSKESLELSAGCGGTGFCVTNNLLREHGWSTETLTEDLEMEVIYTLKGTRVSWLHNAVVYDEKPCSVRIALRQRTRWLTGHLSVLRKYFFKLVVKGVKTRNFKLLDMAFYLLSPIYWFAVGFLTFMWALELIAHIGIFFLGTTEAIILVGWMLFLYPGVGIYLETRSLKDLTLIPYMLVFAPIWVLALLLTIRNPNEKEWFHTPHGRDASKINTFSVDRVNH